MMGMVLVSDFFPKWHEILYIWLTNDPNHEEVGEWFSWWQSQIPGEINDLAMIQDEWNKGLQTMDHALNLGDRAAAELPRPALPMQSALPTREQAVAEATAAAPAPTITTARCVFRDIVGVVVGGRWGDSSWREASVAVSGFGQSSIYG